MEISGLYIYIDGSDLEGVSEPVESAIRDWLKSKDVPAKIVNVLHERTPDLSSEDYAQWDLGLNLEMGQIGCLSELLVYIHKLAVKHERDFVIGYYSEATGISEDISFFGADSGEPKTQEIAEFIGIKNC
jgi:hypothetical protein